MIRMMIPNRICKQYLQFCEETGFTPMGKRTMLSILEECKASVRTSLQGLDYFIVNGTEAFNQLQQVVERLVLFGQSQTWGRQQTQLLKSSKQYIQSDYKVHVSDSSEVADHCLTYALSEHGESRETDFFAEECQHTHEQACGRCEELYEVIDNIEEGVANATISSTSERDDLEYTIKEAKADIHALKAHQLRLINQQKAKANAFDNLDDSTVYVVQDWAMKFVPAKYRESQTEWFGKRGIPWHVSVMVRRKDGVLESETLLHVFYRTTQDSSAVIAIMNHTMHVLKEDMPSVKNVFYMSDNAGCYHCTATIQAALDMSRKIGVRIKQLDFTEAQGGKGICDRKAAMVKNHIRIYVDEGNNVETAEHFKQAVESHGGIPGVKVFLCHLESKLTPGRSIDNVKSYNNFKFTQAGVLVFKAYGIGKGKLLDKVDQSAPPSMSVSGTTQAGFEPVKPRRKKARSPSNDLSIDDESGDDEPQNMLFSCPEEGCVKVYKYYMRLEDHVMFGKHVKAPDKETLHDKVKLMYAEKISSFQTAYQPTNYATPQEHADNTELERGWALPVKKTVMRFNAKQRAFLDRIFQTGQRSGSKADPDTVSKEMRYAKDINGHRLFSITEFLSPKQIASYFSRTSMKVRGTVSSDNTDELDDTQIQNRAQQNHVNVFEEALDVVGLKHPIISHSYNLCSLVAENRLKDLHLPVLKMICHALEINMDTKDKRKRHAYQRELENLVYSCSCQT